VEPSPFFDETDDTEAQEEFILGSPVRALNVPNGFHRHYFFDLDETRAETLRAVTAGRNGVTVQVGDCNPLIRNLTPSLKTRSIRGVAFLDPGKGERIATAEGILHSVVGQRVQLVGVRRAAIAGRRIGLDVVL